LSISSLPILWLLGRNGGRNGPSQVAEADAGVA
jgi:hypothetical protein